MKFILFKWYWKKYWTHHRRKYVYDVSKFYLWIAIYDCMNWCLRIMISRYAPWIELPSYAPQRNLWTTFNSWLQSNQIMPERAIHCKSFAWQITCKPLRWQRQLPRSYRPWGCYLRQIIDAERVCKLACKRVCEAQQGAKHRASSASRMLWRARSMRPIISMR